MASSAGGWLGLVVAFGWLAAGVVMWRLPASKALGRIVLAGSGFGLSAAASSLAELTGPLAVALLLSIATSGHLLLAFAAGKAPSSRRRAAPAALYGVAAAVGIGTWATGHHLSAIAAVVALFLVLVFTLPLAHAAYLASTGSSRRRLQWVACGVLVTAEFAVLAVTLRVLLRWPHDPQLVAAGGATSIPLAIVAGWRERPRRCDRALVGLDALLGFTIIVGAAYTVAVLVLGRALTGGERGVLALAMLAAAASAGLWVIGRGRLMAVANRLVYGEARAPQEAVRLFGSRVTRAIPIDELLLQVAESLRKSMSLSSAEIFAGSGEMLERIASVPDRGRGGLHVVEPARSVVARGGVSGNAWTRIWLPSLADAYQLCHLRVAPLTHLGELLGVIVVARPEDQESFDQADDQALGDLARQVGLTLQNVELDAALKSTLDEVRRQAAELQASRTRVVAAADAERRKIERNLHDGAQQHLVSIAISARLARDLVDRDPAAAREMLDALGVATKETIQEIRDLAHGIYPPLLADMGIAGALRAAALRSPLATTVEADNVGRYPVEFESAIYFCCLEAMQNAAKHAPGARVRVQVREEAGGLLFEIADDGPGFDSGSITAGHGYLNMKDRLGAIGGAVHWESSVGNGAVVAGSIPLP